MGLRGKEGRRNKEERKKEENLRRTRQSRHCQYRQSRRLWKNAGSSQGLGPWWREWSKCRRRSRWSRRRNRRVGRRVGYSARSASLQGWQRIRQDGQHSRWTWEQNLLFICMPLKLGTRGKEREEKGKMERDLWLTQRINPSEGFRQGHQWRARRRYRESRQFSARILAWWPYCRRRRRRHRRWQMTRRGRNQKLGWWQQDRRCNRSRS